MKQQTCGLVAGLVAGVALAWAPGAFAQGAGEEALAACKAQQAQADSDYEANSKALSATMPDMGGVVARWNDAGRRTLLKTAPTSEDFRALDAIHAELIGLRNQSVAKLDTLSSMGASYCRASIARVSGCGGQPPSFEECNKGGAWSRDMASFLRAIPANWRDATTDDYKNVPALVALEREAAATEVAACPEETMEEPTVRLTSVVGHVVIVRGLRSLRAQAGDALMVGDIVKVDSSGDNSAVLSIEGQSLRLVEGNAFEVPDFKGEPPAGSLAEGIWAEVKQAIQGPSFEVDSSIFATCGVRG
ncbi:MAG: hypothetical protein R3C52_02160 [Hyphomonadaceae bacterium]